jgi:hypothetical protein
MGSSERRSRLALRNFALADASAFAFSTPA